MVCNCSSRSGCQTSRCECKKRDEKCDSSCDCNPDVCMNQKGCRCSNKSKCVTTNCECKAENEPCDPSHCQCSSSKCENISSKNKSNQPTSARLSNPVKQSELSSEVKTAKDSTSVVKEYHDPKCSNSEWSDFAEKLTKDLRKSVTKKREQVTKHRNGIDLYTNASRLDNPHVDHIIEDQMLGHAAAMVLYNYASTDRFIQPLRGVINEMDNYNVTEGNLNQSKGSVIKHYLKDERYKVMPLRAQVLNATSETYFKKYVNNIQSAMSEAGEFVLNNIETVRRDDNYISGREVFVKVEKSLEDLLDKMDLNPDSGVKTRRNK